MKKPIYKQFIFKKPSRSLIDGITMNPQYGKPVYETAVQQHGEYVKAIQNLGIKTHVLEPNEQYPDSCFVEDPAVIVSKKLAILTNPGTSSRNGEVFQIYEALREHFKPSQIKTITFPGTMDGGDVMEVGDTFYIGVSARTNKEGIKQFASYVKAEGKKVVSVPLHEYLHLKTGVNYIENNNLLITGEFVGNPIFDKFNQIVVSKEEEYGANCVYVNGYLIMPKGYPEVQNKLEKLKGYKGLIILDTSEFKKIDGGLTCLSLRF
ncbi:dimethylarginine dimethylaminohydrolase family protein [Mycoplasma crocodyli]|uniref:Dimethylargininase (N[G],N[G]-dimethylarginine dimethylaminohydrolase) n=1 Tax=Mycoplasma crocodyli (strain ATCC 51981 / MP145) TaxID=512564 RepID=D5E539_MYCCM|nr:arginine deiminase family protein [Mycoplasma crocodyli]ADE20032.1 dimethylargininase (N[G],N[G]-dimethylarginine dimethylaminohydrolase) [Mycoplasma crocodyli MP145]